MSLIKGQNRSWYSRGDLSHFDKSLVSQGITSRYADSRPTYVVHQLQYTAQIDTDALNRARWEEFMKAGYGAC